MLLVMSGFPKNGSYFVLHTHLRLPYELTPENLVHRFFPRIDKWCEQQFHLTRGGSPRRPALCHLYHSVGVAAMALPCHVSGWNLLGL